LLRPKKKRITLRDPLHHAYAHQKRCKIFFLRNSAYDLSYSGVKPFVAALLLQKEPAAL